MEDLRVSAWVCICLLPCARYSSLFLHRSEVVVFLFGQAKPLCYGSAVLTNRLFDTSLWKGCLPLVGCASPLAVIGAVCLKEHADVAPSLFASSSVFLPRKAEQARQNGCTKKRTDGTGHRERNLRANRYRVRYLRKVTHKHWRKSQSSYRWGMDIPPLVHYPFVDGAKIAITQNPTVGILFYQP